MTRVGGDTAAPTRGRNSQRGKEVPVMKTLRETLPEHAATRRARIYAGWMRIVAPLPRPVRRILAVFGIVLALVLAPVAAFAEDAGATDAASGATSLFSGATSMISGTLIPAVVGIVLIGSLLWLAIRWFQKGKNAGNK